VSLAEEFTDCLVDALPGAIDWVTVPEVMLENVEVEYRQVEELDVTLVK
jgi:hypothetical protein